MAEVELSRPCAERDKLVPCDCGYTMLRKFSAPTCLVIGLDDDHMTAMQFDGKDYKKLAATGLHEPSSSEELANRRCFGKAKTTC